MQRHQEKTLRKFAEKYWVATLALVLTGATFLTFTPEPAYAQSPTWIATWGASPVTPDTGITIANLTVRESTH